MATVEIKNRYESLTTALEFISEHPDVADSIVVPGRHIVNLCVSPVEEIESADHGNAFMHPFIPTDHKLNGSTGGMKIDYFEESKELLRLGRISVPGVDCFNFFEDPQAPSVVEGDATGLYNVFRQARAAGSLKENIDKPLMVRFYPSSSFLSDMLKTGENTTVVPLMQIESRRKELVDGRVASIENTIAEAESAQEIEKAA